MSPPLSLVAQEFGAEVLSAARGHGQCGRLYSKVVKAAWGHATCTMLTNTTCLGRGWGGGGRGGTPIFQLNWFNLWRDFFPQSKAGEGGKVYVERQVQSVNYHQGAQNLQIAP